MKKINIIFILLSLSLACAKIIEKEPSLERTYFKDMKGCFLLYNMKTRQFEKVIGVAQCRERYPACSTFKVPLAVMAFDSGVLKDENVVLKWDGIKGSREVLNRDHDAKTWMRDSIVWYSQRLTPELGKEKLGKYLDMFNYGNQNLSKGILTAWLTSPSLKNQGLEISPYEQVDFMKRLWSFKLPVSRRAMKLTQKITFQEITPKGFKFSGKTGSNFYDKEKKLHLGWFISHLERGDEEYIAVTNLSDLKPFAEEGYGGPRAREITKKILIQEGLW